MGGKEKELDLALDERFQAGAQIDWRDQALVIVLLGRIPGEIVEHIRHVFGNVLIIPGDTDVVTASLVSLPSDPQVLVERLRSRGIRSRLISEPFIRYVLTNDRFSEVGETLRTRTAPLNTDRRPICYQLTALLWLSKFYPALTALSFGEIESLMKEMRTWIAAAAGLMLILFVIARMRPSWRGTLLVGVAGFGMVFEIGAVPQDLPIGCLLPQKSTLSSTLGEVP